MFIEIKFTSKKNVMQALSASFSKLEHKALNYMINRCRMNPSFSASYQTIAKSLKCSEKTIRRAVNKFISMGLMTKSVRYCMDICKFTINASIYKFADYFRYKFDSLKKHYNLGRKIDYLKKLKQNVRPLCSNLLSKIFIPRKSYVVDNQSQGIVKRGNFLTKREDVEVSPPTITPTLRQITDRIGLTKLGQLKLMCIPEDILSSVWHHCKKQSGVNNPFDWIMANCLRRCEKLNIDINWELFYLSVKRYGLKDNKKYVSDKSIIKVPRTKFQRSVDSIIRPHQEKKQPHPEFAIYFAQAMENTHQS